MTGQFEPQGAKAGRADLVSFPQAGVAVVFGASGGIGRALVEAIRAAERFEHVVAFSRSTSPSIDLMDEASLERAAAFAATGLEVHPPPAAARHLLAVVDQLTAEANGGFFDWRAQPVPW